MLFNSLQFFIFFVIVYSLYLILNHKWQNRLLLVASYIFYGAWDWRFLTLLWFSTLMDFFLARRIEGAFSQTTKRRWLICSVVLNLGILGIFKYFNFFVDSLQCLLSYFHIHLSPATLHIVLPVGISFYTFQSLSYTIDVYYGKIKATRYLSDFALYVAFFPQLVAGPIERATHLLPQVSSPRRVTLEGFYQGCFLAFWGFFEKVFVADNLAKIVDPVFTNSSAANGLEVLTALYAFAFQIFCDFDGYSNIARGVAQCMGFEIMVNFRWPYFAVSPREFWQRWHISLSTWLKDYLYIPLGGNRGGELKTYRNLFITMFLGGLWHGASWTFVLWGVYHGSLLILHRLFSPLVRNISRNICFPSWSRNLQMVLFFHLVCFGWLLFRSTSIGQIGQMVHALFGQWSGVGFQEGLKAAVSLVPFLWILLLIQIVQYVRNDPLVMLKFRPLTRMVFYYVCLMALIVWGETGAKEFIYFQF